jgi:drug/metabolite transporter (DMT)-like permease
MCYNNTIKLTQAFDIDFQPIALFKSDANSQSKILGWIGVALLILAGATYPSFGKKLTTAFSPVSLLFLSEFLGGIFVAIWFGAVPMLKKWKKVKKSEKKLFLFSSMINGVIAPLLWFIGLSSTSAVNAELFSRTEMLFMILLGVIVIHEKFTKQHAFSLSVILMGIICVALRGFTETVNIAIGDMLIVTSALVYALGSIIVKKTLHGVPPELIIVGRASMAALTFFAVSPFITFNIGNEFSNINKEILIALIGYGFIAKFLGTYGFYQAIEHLKVRTVSMMGTLAIVGGMFFAAMYLGEHIHMYQIIGGSMIVLGVLLTHKVGVHSSEKVHEHHMIQHHRNQI